MAYLTDFQYYNNNNTVPTDANWGSYQYVKLYDIVNNFMLNYTGNHSIINNEVRNKAIFHAKRAIQELSYDAFKEVKVLMLDISDQLRVVLPPDYVNWVRISLYKDGVLMPLSENIQTMSATSYLKDNSGNLLFDQDGNVLSPEFSKYELDRINNTQKSIYLNSNSQYNNTYGWNIEGVWYFDFAIGARYGLNTETANRNPTFRVDSKSGVINFSSGIQGDTVLLEYITDGLNPDDETISVNKLFEAYVYAYIEYEILDSKVGVQEYIVRRKQKKKSALLNNAKIRMSGLHPSRLLMNLRGQNKWLK
jgi:hypothetical protein